MSGGIVFKSDADLNSLFCDVNISGYFPTTICLYPENKSPPTLNLSNLNSIDSRIDTVFQLMKKMIQIIGCWFIKTKNIPFDQQENFMEMYIKFLLHLALNTCCLKIILDVVEPTHHLIYRVNVQN